MLRVYHSAVVAPWRQRDEVLRSSGIEVTLVAPRKWNEGGQDVRLVDPPKWVIPCMTIGRHPYRFAYGPVGLLRAFLRGRYDIIDIHEEPASLAAGEVLGLARLLQRRAHVLLYSAQNIEKRYPPPFRWIEAWTLRRASGAYPCNKAAATILQRKGLQGPAPVLGLGVDTRRFEPGPEPPRAVLGYAGRLEVHKGVDVLLRALADLPGTEAEIVGDGPDRQRLVDLARALEIEDRVTFTGHVSHEELPDFYRRLAVLAVPSLPTSSWEEQFCRVAVEAMASGVPVIASRSGALPEVVADAGVLVPPGDSAALVTAARSLLASRERRRELGALGVERARAFTWERVASAHGELYEAVTE